MTQHLELLTKELSPFRGEYYHIILETTSSLLELYDNVLLHGYAETKEKEFKGQEPYFIGWGSAYGSEERRKHDSITDELVENYRQSASPEQFLYGVRRAFLEVSESAERAHSYTASSLQTAQKLLELRKDLGQELQVDKLSLFALSVSHEGQRTLQQDCATLRGIYDFMRQTVQEKMQR
jgi:hypothetical protein